MFENRIARSTRALHAWEMRLSHLTGSGRGHAVSISEHVINILPVLACGALWVYHAVAPSGGDHNKFSLTNL